MLSDTSLVAWLEVLPSIGERQYAVYTLLRQRGPLTNAQISTILEWSINRVTPRVFELRKMGLVREYDKVQCPVTGRMAHAWTVVKYGESV